MSAPSIPAIAMASISFYVSFSHFLNYARRRQRREDLSFAILCLATGLYAVFCAGLYSVTTVADGARWQRAQFIILPVFVISFIWFAATYTRQRPGILIYVFTAFYLAAIVIQIVDRSGLTWRLDAPSIKAVTLPFGAKLTYYEAEFGPFTTVQSFMGLVVSAYTVWLGIRHGRSGHWREARPLLVALGLMYAAGINDTAVSIGWYSFIYLIEYAYMAVILLMTISLSNTVVEAAMTKDALYDSEERFRSLVETTSDWVWEVDTHGVYTYASPKSRDLLGYEPAELIGKTPFDMMEAHEARRVRGQFEQAIASRLPITRMENTIRCKDGRHVVLETSGVPVTDASGRISGYRGIDRDITDRKQAQEEKTRLQEQLQQAMKMEAVGRLAGGIAHDFNNLLTAILGNVDLARLSLNAPDATARSLDGISSAAESAASLTRQLLAFSRRQMIEPKVVNLNDLVRNLQPMLTRLIGEDVTLQTVMERTLGSVKVDPGQFEQVLVNLAVNARDAMPEGGRLLIETSNVDLDEQYCARHAQTRPGRFVLLAVSDTGCGMSEEVKRHVFEPFFTTKPPGKGTGLGLATTFGIVKQAGGSIELYSEVGRGTSFKIYLPRIDARPQALTERRTEAGIPKGSETVLLVEDDESVREAAASELAYLGYTVLSVPTADEVLEFVEGRPGRIDLLMTDVVMPGINGRDLADKLIALHPEMKVLFTSGYTQNVIVHHGVVDEGVNFIGKPYSVQTLARKLREVLDAGK